MVWFVLGHSGRQISVKCAEAVWNYKAGGIVHLKSPAVLFFVFVFVFDNHTPRVEDFFKRGFMGFKWSGHWSCFSSTENEFFFFIQPGFLMLVRQMDFSPAKCKALKKNSYIDATCWKFWGLVGQIYFFYFFVRYCLKMLKYSPYYH